MKGKWLFVALCALVFTHGRSLAQDQNVTLSFAKTLAACEINNIASAGSVHKSQPVLSASDGVAISPRESIGVGPC
jgi:hypothetical protein